MSVSDEDYRKYTGKELQGKDRAIMCNIAKFSDGSDVTLSGMIKKELYFRGLIMYPDDYAKIKEYEESTKEKFSETPEATKEASKASVGKLKKK